MRCARLLTVTTREPGTGSICSSSSPVRAKCPRWLVPSCSSNPSSVVCFGGNITPALLISRSILGCRARSWAAAALPFSASRTASTTEAPRAARTWAVSNPRPVFAPVTTASRPCWPGTSSLVHFAFMIPPGCIANYDVRLSSIIGWTTYIVKGRIGSMPRRTDSRSRMIAAAAELFRQRGYHATTFSDVVRDSGAPRGSTYFHFPGGKAELAREAIARAGDEMEELIDDAARQASDPASLVRALAQIMAGRLERSGYQSGCAIATMVLELAPGDEEFSAAFDTVFARWRTALVTRFEPLGIAPGRATILAGLTISAIEGALVLSRAARSTEPFTSNGHRVRR